MSVYGHDAGWAGPLILEPLPTPPPDRIRDPGGRLVTVSVPRGTSPHRQHPAVLLAWAHLPGGDWACLMTWGGWRRASAEDRRRDLVPSARWAWVRYRRDLVTALKPWPDHDPGLRWFGRHSGSEFEAAYVEAAASLPETMRDAALTYTPDLGPAWH